MNGDLSIDPGKATLYATPLSFAPLAAVIVPHHLLHGENALKALYRAIGSWWFAPALLAGIVAHEALHVATWAAVGRLRWSDLSVGVNWRLLMPYAHPRRPVTAWSYAVGAAIPGLLLGLVPAALGLALARGVWSGWGAIFSAAAAGDLLVLWSLRGVPSETLVQDHPTRVGCEIVARNDAA